MIFSGIKVNDYNGKIHDYSTANSSKGFYFLFSKAATFFLFIGSSCVIFHLYYHSFIICYCYFFHSFLFFFFLFYFLHIFINVIFISFFPSSYLFFFFFFFFFATVCIILYHYRTKSNKKCYTFRYLFTSFPSFSSFRSPFNHGVRQRHKKREIRYMI